MTAAGTNSPTATPCSCRLTASSPARQAHDPATVCGPNSVCSLPQPLWETRLTLGCRIMRLRAEVAGSDRRGLEPPRAWWGVRRAWRARRSFVRPIGSDAASETHSCWLSLHAKCRETEWLADRRSLSLRWDPPRDWPPDLFRLANLGHAPPLLWPWPSSSIARQDNDGRKLVRHAVFRVAGQ